LSAWVLPAPATSRSHSSKTPTTASQPSTSSCSALEQILRDYEVFVEAGLAGLEINHRENTEEGKRVLAQVALEFDLIVTGSSDFHGTKKPNHLGENTTAEDQLERILERASGSLPLS